MSEETRYLKEILNNQVIENYGLDDEECYLNGYARKCLNKVLEELERQENVITELNDDNEYLTDNINSLEVENTRLNNIINELEKWIIENDRWDSDYVFHDFDGFYGIKPDYILDKINEIIDKINEMENK